MTPLFAFGLTILLIGYLIRRDGSIAPRPSPAVWIPTFWLLINGSRQPSQWLGLRSGSIGQALYEGSTFDEVIYGTLIMAGIVVLANRRFGMDQVAKSSWWIILFFLYEGLSCVW